MMEVTQVSDLDKMLGLLKEYTRLLRETCQRELERRTRIATLRVAAACIASLATLGAIGYLQYQNVPAVGSTISALAMCGALALFSVVVSLFTNRGTFSYDADQVAHTLQRLTEMTSQYSEHATRRISDKFELDLRLAEAEGVLKMYTKLFGYEHIDDRNNRTRHSTGRSRSQDAS